MNNVQNLLHSPEIQEKLHIKSAHVKLDADKKRQLGNAYLKLYFGLSCMNWTNKKNLGTAWQTAFSQVQNILNARDEKNPATQFLKIMHQTHKETWPRHIMTHPQRDSVFNGDAGQMREYAIRNIRSAMGEITLLSSQAEFTMDKALAKQVAKQPTRVATQNQPKDMARPEQNASPRATVPQPEHNQREQLAKIIRAQMPMYMKVQQADKRTQDAGQKEIIPQTRTGEQIAGRPGVNSADVPRQQAAANSKQVTLRPVNQPRSPSGERADMQDKAKIFNLWARMRAQMFNQNNGRAA